MEKILLKYVKVKCSQQNKTKHNKNWPYTPDHPNRILIGGSGSRKTNVLLSLIKEQPDIDKIYLYAKDPYEQSINI